MADQLKTGLRELDEILSGEGMPRGRLFSVTGRADPEMARARTRAFLVEEAWRQGRSVVFFTLEMAKPPDDPITT